MFHRLPSSHTQPPPKWVPKDPLPPLHASIHRAVEKCYADFIDLMELTPEEGAELIDLLSAYQCKLTQHDRRIESHGEASSGLQFRERLKDQLDLTLTRLIGPARYEYFENYRIGLLLK